MRHAAALGRIATRAPTARAFSASGVASGDVFADIAGKMQTAEGRARWQRVRQRYDEMSAFARSVPAEPAPIDWDFYRKELFSAPELVDKLQKDYEAYDFPRLEDQAEFKAAVSDNNAGRVSDLADARACSAKAAELLEQVNERIADSYANRTTVLTTVDDIQERFPEIKEQIEAQIEEGDWEPLRK